LLDKIEITRHGFAMISAAMATHLNGITGRVRMCREAAANRGFYA
jgi:hypothetical protein